jgi:hypothetical protein
MQPCPNMLGRINPSRPWCQQQVPFFAPAVDTKARLHADCLLLVQELLCCPHCTFSSIDPS